jgi:hypothetical protein
MAAGGNGGIITWDAATFQSCEIEMWVRLPDADAVAENTVGIVFAWTDNANFYRACLRDAGATERTEIFEVNTSRAAGGGIVIAATAWYKLKVWIRWNGASLESWVFLNDSIHAYYDDASPRPTPGRVGIWCSNTNGARIWADTFQVTKLFAAVVSVASGDFEEYYTSFGLQNMKELAATMTRGDILVSDGTVLAKLSPGVIGTELTAHDPGNPLTWEYPP